MAITEKRETKFKDTEIGLIPEEWEVKELGQISFLQRGFDLPIQDRIEGKYPILSSSGTNGYHSEFKVQGPGVVTGRSGQLGNVFYTKENYWPLNTTLWVKDFFGNDPYYTYLLLSQIKFADYNAGSSVPTLNRNHIHSLLIALPPLPEQKAIAEILSSLDEKIELNRRMNKTLEEMGKALFKRWFVDFEFPNEDGKPYKSSGGKMVDSELGEIPEGWEIVTVESIAEIRNGFAFKSSDYRDSGFPIIRTMNFTDEGFIDANNLVYLKEDLVDKYSNFRLSLFDFLLVMVGASIGKSAIVTDVNIPALQNQNMWNFQPKSKEQLFYNIFTLKEIITKNINSASGSARDFFRKDFYRQISVLKPSKKYLEAFNTVMSDIYLKISLNICQVDNLNKLRETLLPKLISGRIRT